VCNIKVPINMSSVKAIGDIMEVMLLLHHNARSLPKRQGPTKKRSSRIFKS
jgi:hypothetical protein